MSTDLILSFSSTTIEEALVNEIPVILYGGDGRYSHIPINPFAKGDKIEQPVTFLKNKKDLGVYLKRLDKKNTEFLVEKNKFKSYRFDNSELNNFSEWINQNIILE